MAARGRQRRLALGVLFLAAVVAVAALPFRHAWWGGWILAIAEAGIVGGLADWFAVTALFRRPLGLPIPHTALIPANWELMARRVGSMVGDRVLTRQYLSDEISRVDVGGLIAAGAGRVTREDLEAATRRGAEWVLEQVPAETPADLLARLRERLGGIAVSPVLAAGIDLARKHGWDRRLIDAALGGLAEAAARPVLRRALEEIVGDVVGHYRRALAPPAGLALGLADLLGLVDRRRIVDALLDAFRRVAEDPDHPARRRLVVAVAELPGRLRHDAALRRRVEAAARDLLAGPVAGDLVADLAAAARRALADDLGRPRSEVAAWVAGNLDRARRALIADPALRADLDRWAKARALDLLERHHGHVARFIEKGVHALGPDGAVRLIEEHAGDDLQYIRVNGTIVGGLAGGGLYGVRLLFGAL
jgi:uncharacterized membrane-anchored protein YjiN (DUF445 family)